MPALWRLGFLMLAILSPVFLIAWMALANADWQACFGDGAIPYDYLWRAIRANLLPPSKETLLLVAAPMLPAIAAIALARRPLVAGIAIAPTLILLVSLVGAAPSSGHDCDRKGCGGCDGIVVWMWLLQLPMGGAVMMGAGIQRLLPILRRRSSA